MQKLRWRAALVLATVAGAAFLIVDRPANLGLDLQGGTQIVLEARDAPGRKVDSDTLDRTLEVLRRRVDQLGVAEPYLQRSGDRRIIVELPGVADPEEAVAVIGKTAELTFHAVLPARVAGEVRAAGQVAPLRVLVLAAVLALLVGLPAVIRRGSVATGRDSRPLRTRRHAIALRAPPLQFA